VSAIEVLASVPVLTAFRAIQKEYMLKVKPGPAVGYDFQPQGWVAVRYLGLMGNAVGKGAEA
jgi:hypothetical protein